MVSDLSRASRTASVREKENSFVTIRQAAYGYHDSACVITNQNCYKDHLRGHFFQISRFFSYQIKLLDRHWCALTIGISTSTKKQPGDPENQAPKMVIQLKI